MESVSRWGLAALALALAAGAVGCGTPAAPQPPSLKLPERVTDLAAVRTGSQVALTWTMPKKNTDKLVLKGQVSAKVCRRETGNKCESAGMEVKFAPGAHASFAETLPAGLTVGDARVLEYFVELTNRNGRSAGLSNAARILAGAAPGPVAELNATVRKAGVELHWAAGVGSAPVRLQRKLLSPPKPEANAGRGPMAEPKEAVDQNLFVEDGAKGGALDATVRFGETYEYRAQHVARVSVGGETLELDGELTAPVRVDVKDVFPPAVPAGLAAVVTMPEPGAQGDQAQPSIDLSWQPVAEADLAGYIVYRREGAGEWVRISPPRPVVGPAFHDARVQAGHGYEYAVSAIDQSGHESARSAAAQESVPSQ
jgi:hypothetical protein